MLFRIFIIHIVSAFFSLFYNLGSVAAQDPKILLNDSYALYGKARE